MKIKSNYLLKLLMIILIVIFSMNIYHYNIGKDALSGEIISHFYDYKSEIKFNPTKYTGIDVTLMTYSNDNTSFTKIGSYNFKDTASIFDVLDMNKQEQIIFNTNIIDIDNPIIKLEDIIHSINIEYDFNQDNLSEFNFDDYEVILNDERTTKLLKLQEFELQLCVLEHKTNDTILLIKVSLR